MANERRLIDANALKERWTIASPTPYSTDAAEVLDTINEAPTVDAVEVCRCKDCVFYRETQDWNGDAYKACHLRADVIIQKRNQDDFCSYGEKRESGTQRWIDGEPVEGNRERLMALLKETPDVMVWPDALAKLTQHLIANGVTFREV